MLSVSMPYTKFCMRKALKLFIVYLNPQHYWELYMLTLLQSCYSYLFVFFSGAWEEISVSTKTGFF